MLQDFSIDKTLQDLREYSRILQECQSLLEESRQTSVSSIAKKIRRETLEKEKQNKLMVREKYGIFSRIANIFGEIASAFHIGKYYEAKQLSISKQQELERVIEECEQLAQKEAELERRIAEIVSQKDAKSMPECMREEQGRVVITDKKTELSERDLVKNTTTVEPSKKVLIHCTNFFPMDNKILSSYDGGKIGTTVKEYHGVAKETSALIHRHEVHFTINNRVENTGAGEGNWDNPSYIIIDGYDVHQDEMESDCPSDAWTKGTSMQLSKSAVIMVRLQDKDKLPISPEEMKYYNIIFYDGDATRCLRNFLRLNDYDIFNTDPNCPIHAYSNRMIQEKGANERDLAINFVRDNTHFSKELPIFSEEEIAQIVDIGCINTAGVISNTQLRLCSGGRYDVNGEDYRNILEYFEAVKDMGNKREQYRNVANFIICSGMKITEDGRYTFSSDDEIFHTIESLKQDTETLPEGIDVNLINKIFEMQQELSRRHKCMELPPIEEFSSMPLQELYRFKNQLACEALQKTLPEHTQMSYGKKGVTISKVELKSEEEEFGKRVSPEDGIYYTEFGNMGLFEKIIAGTTSASNAGKILADFKLLIEQIKTREVVDLDFER